MERQTWKGRKLFLRPFSYMLKGMIGYGYFSLSALWWLLALIIIGSAVYRMGYDARNMVPTEKDAFRSFDGNGSLPADYEAFYALPYSLENSFPLVKLGVQDKWMPRPGGQRSHRQPSALVLRIASPVCLRGFRWLQICAGWVIATLFVGGVTGIVRND